MPTLEDKEFGTITVRKTSSSRSMKATVAPNGTLRISVPSYTPMFMIRRMIAGSRDELRTLLDSRPKLVLSDGMQIGKSHTLLIRSAPTRSVKRSGNQLLLSLAPGDSLEDPETIDKVRTHILAILRREAKHHLPHRIRYLADTYGFEYTSLRFTHASSRWGSCNSKKAISLNIALMNLPYELIDYVLIHELSHTKHLDHSERFWKEVGRVDIEYLVHRKQLKRYNPGI